MTGDNAERDRLQVVLGLKEIEVPPAEFSDCIYLLSTDTTRSPSNTIEYLVSANIVCQEVKVALENLNLKFDQEKE